MDQDKALKKILKAREKVDLPYGFEFGLMKKIMLEAEKKKKRSAVLSLCLVSSVSAAMIAGVVILLKYYLSVEVAMPSISVTTPHDRFSPEAGSLFGFFFYIAFLVLILLGLDTYFRKLKQKN